MMEWRAIAYGYFNKSNFILLKNLINRKLPNIAHPRKTSQLGEILWLFLSVGLVTKKWHADMWKFHVPFQRLFYYL